MFTLSSRFLRNFGCFFIVSHFRFILFTAIFCLVLLLSHLKFKDFEIILKWCFVRMCPCDFYFSLSCVWASLQLSPVFDVKTLFTAYSISLFFSSPFVAILMTRRKNNTRKLKFVSDVKVFLMRICLCSEGEEMMEKFPLWHVEGCASKISSFYRSFPFDLKKKKDWKWRINVNAIAITIDNVDK